MDKDKYDEAIKLAFHAERIEGAASACTDFGARGHILVRSILRSVERLSKFNQKLRSAIRWNTSTT